MTRKNKKTNKNPTVNTIRPNEDTELDKQKTESNQENAIQETQDDKKGNDISTNCLNSIQNDDLKVSELNLDPIGEELCKPIVSTDTCPKENLTSKSESVVEKATEILVWADQDKSTDSKQEEENRKLEMDKKEMVEISQQKCCICGEKGQRCVKCKAVVLCKYCLPRHYHFGRCLPWTTREVSGQGKCLVATRSIKPLEVVIEDSAVVTVPVGKMSCVGCGRGVNCAYSCSFCLLPLCGSGCPRGDIHKIECPSLEKCVSEPLTLSGKNHPIFSAVGCIRFLQMKHKEPENYLKLISLDPQIERIKTDNRASKLLCDIKEQLKHLDYKEEDIDHAYGLLKLYGYNLPDVPDGKVRSIFPVQSLLNHSCLPNLQYIEKEGGRKIVLQSTTKIEKGELLTVRFTPFLQGRISLTKWLNEQRYISCKCPRCIDGTELGTFTSSALCDQPECRERGGLLLPLDPVNRSEWICSSCQTIMSQVKVEEIEEKYITKFRELPQGDLNEYYRFLNELGDRFHASHHLVMRMAHFLVLLQGKRLESLSRERIETQSVLCDKLLVYVSRLDPGATQTRAKLLLEKNKADLNLAKLDCEAGRINRKVFMAKIKEGVRVEVNAKKILYFKWEDK